MKKAQLKTFSVRVKWQDLDEVKIKASSRQEAMAEALCKFQTGFGNMKAEIVHCRKVK